MISMLPNPSDLSDARTNAVKISAPCHPSKAAPAGRILLKSITSKTRSHSLFRQGCMLYELIPNMPEHRFAPLMTAFVQAVSKATAFSGLSAVPK
jgi:hypothetical protein